MDSWTGIPGGPDSARGHLQAWVIGWASGPPKK